MADLPWNRFSPTASVPALVQAPPPPASGVQDVVSATIKATLTEILPAITAAAAERTPRMTYPTKQRVALPDNTSVHDTTTPPTAVVLEQKPGPVTWLDKAKGYYKGLIATIGAVLVFLNELTPLTSFLPEDAQHWVSVGVAVLTALFTTLKSNEVWLDDL
jgi:hypothetical protein